MLTPLPDQPFFISRLSQHLGAAQRLSEGEWLAVDNYGKGVGFIWAPYLWRPALYRCDSLPYAPYVPGITSEDFSLVLDHALNHFSQASIPTKYKK